MPEFDPTILVITTGLLVAMFLGGVVYAALTAAQLKDAP